MREPQNISVKLFNSASTEFNLCEITQMCLSMGNPPTPSCVCKPCDLRVDICIYAITERERLLTTKTERERERGGCRSANAEIDHMRGKRRVESLSSTVGHRRAEVPKSQNQTRRDRKTGADGVLNCSGYGPAKPKPQSIT